MKSVGLRSTQFRSRSSLLGKLPTAIVSHFGFVVFLLVQQSSGGADLAAIVSKWMQVGGGKVSHSGRCVSLEAERRQGCARLDEMMPSLPSEIFAFTSGAAAACSLQHFSCPALAGTTSLVSYLLNSQSSPSR